MTILPAFPATSPDVHRTVRETYPPFEGSNIGSWIGFKHLIYLLEEATLQHLREAGVTSSGLYEEHGLSLEILESAIQIHHAVHLDELVRVEVTRAARPDPSRYVVDARLFVRADGTCVKAVTGRLTAACVTNPTAEPTPRATPRPLADGRGTLIHDPALLAQLGADPRRSVVWRWRIPYFYCHYMRRLQHSGYVRLMEEIVDLFLASRGLSIRHMLDTRRWIPVVPEARLQIVEEVDIEDELYTVFTVDSIYKNFFYTATMTSSVLRPDGPIETARGRIVHGYARILGRRDWELVSFDAAVAAALRGEVEERHERPAAAVLL